MRIFVAGGTGAIGRRLVPMLVKAGHQVTGTTRSAAKVPMLKAAGAEAVVIDALDPQAVARAIAAARPEVVVHELTSLPPAPDFRRFDNVFAKTNELRTRGTDNLIDGAIAAGASRFVAQSFAGWPYVAAGAEVKDESDPLEDQVPAKMQRSLDAIRYLESRVTATAGIEGVVLRYAMLYGPPSAVGESTSKLMEEIRRRRIPVVGNGAGVWSFVHVDDAAAATKLAIEKARPGIYNIADDEPARASELFPELARIAGAKAPRHAPVWLAKLLIGAPGVRFMTEMRGVANRKAKEQLGWQPRWSWREGFRSGISETGGGAAAS
jgi:nucleoside-diphosphate-sugar epimerase